MSWSVLKCLCMLESFVFLHREWIGRKWLDLTLDSFRRPLVLVSKAFEVVLNPSLEFVIKGINHILALHEV
jgi:hypothetical protein